MPTKITLSLDGTESKVRFTPKLSNENLGDYINNIVNVFPNACLNILTHIPLLRPACEEEKEARVYVFQEGDAGIAESKLYESREKLYDALTAIFSAVLTTAFPDIEYIKQCKAYQQEFCTTHEDDERKDYLEQVKRVTDYVRQNLPELLRQIYEEEANDVTGNDGPNSGKNS